MSSSVFNPLPAELAPLNGLAVFSAPCDRLPGVLAPLSIEWDEHDVVAQNVSPFTGQTQDYDWRAAWWEAQVSFPPMPRRSHDAWSAFLARLRGPLNAFMLGDPRARLPRGSAKGAPVVAGASQSGYSLRTRGW